MEIITILRVWFCHFRAQLTILWRYVSREIYFATCQHYGTMYHFDFSDFVNVLTTITKFRGRLFHIFPNYGHQTGAWWLPSKAGIRLPNYNNNNCGANCNSEGAAASLFESDFFFFQKKLKIKNHFRPHIP